MLAIGSAFALLFCPFICECICSRSDRERLCAQHTVSIGEASARVRARAYRLIAHAYSIDAETVVCSGKVAVLFVFIVAPNV